jgi:hypothetical protein
MTEPLKREHIEAELKSVDAATLNERVDRLLQVSRLQFVPMGPFAAPSAECVELFRDGRFYGCITLVQAVTEAVIRHVYWIERPNEDRTSFIRLTQRLETLHRSGIIREEVKELVENIWTHRNDFHHLDPSTQQRHQTLEALASEKLSLLSAVETEFFGYSVHEGTIMPNNPKYWDIRDGKTLVYVRRW